MAVSADGAYDAASVYEAVQSRGSQPSARALIPPGRNALPRPSPAWKERNRNVRSIRALGRREWYARSGCSRRGMVENAVYRCPHFVTRYPALETNAVSTIPHARSTTTTVMGKSRIIARLVRS